MPEHCPYCGDYHDRLRFDTFKRGGKIVSRVFVSNERCEWELDSEIERPA